MRRHCRIRTRQRRLRPIASRISEQKPSQANCGYDGKPQSSFPRRASLPARTRQDIGWLAIGGRSQCGARRLTGWLRFRWIAWMCRSFTSRPPLALEGSLHRPCALLTRALSGSKSQRAFFGRSSKASSRERKGGELLTAASSGGMVNREVAKRRWRFELHPNNALLRSLRRVCAGGFSKSTKRVESRYGCA